MTTHPPAVQLVLGQAVLGVVWDNLNAENVWDMLGMSGTVGKYQKLLNNQRAEEGHSPKGQAIVLQHCFLLDSCGAGLRLRNPHSVQNIRSSVILNRSSGILVTTRPVNILSHNYQKHLL